MHSFIQEVGYGSGRRWSVGENLAFASWALSARAVFALWLRSDEHRANVLSPRWRDIGIVELSDDGPDEQTVVWVVEFGWTRAG